MLGRQALRTLLEDLATELSDTGIRGEMFVFGGGAMALAYNTRRSTRDIDAIVEPKTLVYEAARRLGAQHELEPDWLNDAVKGSSMATIPAPPCSSSSRVSPSALRHPGTCSPVKVLAARVERDEDDILTLARLVGLDTADEVLGVVSAAYPGAAIPPRVQFFLEELFQGGA